MVLLSFIILLNLSTQVTTQLSTQLQIYHKDSPISINYHKNYVAFLINLQLKSFYISVQKQYDTYNSISYVINYYYSYGYFLCLLMRLANLTLIITLKFFTISRSNTSTSAQQVVHTKFYPFLYSSHNISNA